MHKFITSLVVFIILYLLLNNKNSQENYSQVTPQGKLCTSCMGKNINSCLDCFNCGYCVDDWGNGRCVPGDYKGPYNKESCKYYIQGDPYATMMERNRNYKCSYGPSNASRALNGYLE
jgi:hypothetical protein